MSTVGRQNDHQVIDLLDGDVHFIAFGGDVAVLAPVKVWNRHIGTSLPPASGSQDELADLRFKYGKLRGLAGAVLDGRPNAARELRRFLTQLEPARVDGPDRGGSDG